jgi:hypothetical protein
MVGEEPLDVVEGGPALLHGPDDVGDVAVQQDEVGGLAGNVGADHAHGHADVGLPQGGSVVDAVAGHGDDLAQRLQSSGDAELGLRGDPGQHAAVRVGQQLGKLLVVFGELRAL